MILSMLDNKEICYNLSKTVLILFVCTGIALAIFSMDGNTPDERVS